MDNEPLVSVIIPSYNSATFAVEAIESALAQTYKALEIIVIDDGSQDDTKERLKPYSSRINYIYQPNRGPAAARNRGIEAARGELTAFLDADDGWLPEKTARQVASLKANPNAGLVHTDVVFWDGKKEDPSLGKNARHDYHGYCYTQLFRKNRVATSTVLVRRECLSRVGFFDETFCRPTTEDYDLWLRIGREYELEYVPEPLVRYRIHSNNGSQNTLIVRQDELYVLEKALRADAGLRHLVGKNQVAARLFELTFFVGYLYFEQGNYSKAHRLFGKAASLCPTKLYAIALWTATMMPSKLVKSLRRAKQVVESARTSNPRNS